ncbi:MAG: outer membrane beta-barrel protein [Chitinophagaceae bacterium]
MKKIILGSLLLICAFSTLHAQSKKKEIGFIAGIQRSKLDITDLSQINLSEEAKTSFGGAFFLNWRLIGHFVTLRTELGYYTKGGTYRLNNQPVETNLSYIAAPAALVQVDLGGIKAYAGPQLGLLLTAKSKTGSVTQDVKNSFSTTELSGVVGAELNLPFRLLAGARYNFAISNISEIAQVQSKPGMYMVYVGLRLHK